VEPSTTRAALRFAYLVARTRVCVVKVPTLPSSRVSWRFCRKYREYVLTIATGEYNPNHPGLRINVFNNNLNAKNYKMPGPAKFVGSKQLAAPSSTDKPTSSPTPTPAKTETNAPKPSSTKSLKRCPARRNKRGELIKRSDSFEEEKRKHKRDHSRRLSH